MPGKISIHGACVRKSRPSASITPSDEVGGCAPSPRNDRAASICSAKPIRIVACTIAGPIAFGRTWRVMILLEGVPRARAAST